jgi:hypothetical protein
MIFESVVRNARWPAKNAASLVDVEV